MRRRIEKSSQHHCRRVIELLFAFALGLWLGVFLVPKMRDHSETVNDTTVESIDGRGVSAIQVLHSGAMMGAPETMNMRNEPSKYITRSTLVRRPRLLFMSAVYTFDQFLYLQKVLDAMRDHCNAG